MTPRAMILAAGFGTRLGVLTSHRPKPMLPIAGAPLVRWAVLWLRGQGVREIVINLHHHGEKIVEALGDGAALGVDIAYSHETTILGTGGGLRQARSLLDVGDGAPTLVLNGKILMELDLARLLDVHGRSGAEATWVMREDAEGIWGGKLAAGGDGRMATFLGETRHGVRPGPPLMFTGVHLFEPRFFDRIPPEGEQCVARTAYLDLFRRGPGIHTYVSDGYWWEHSTVERYLRGIANVLDGAVALPHAELPLRGVGPGARIHPEAKIHGPVWIGPGVSVAAGAEIGPHVQLGAGVKVAAGVKLVRCAVWEGVRVDRDLQDGVIPA